MTSSLLAKLLVVVGGSAALAACGGKTDSDLSQTTGGGATGQAGSSSGGSAGSAAGQAGSSSGSGGAGQGGTGQAGSSGCDAVMEACLDGEIQFVSACGIGVPPFTKCSDKLCVLKGNACPGTGGAGGTAGASGAGGEPCFKTKVCHSGKITDACIPPNADPAPYTDCGNGTCAEFDQMCPVGPGGAGGASGFGGSGQGGACLLAQVCKNGLISEICIPPEGDPIPFTDCGGGTCVEFDGPCPGTGGAGGSAGAGGSGAGGSVAGSAGAGAGPQGCAEGAPCVEDSWCQPPTALLAPQALRQRGL